MSHLTQLFHFCHEKNWDNTQWLLCFPAQYVVLSISIIFYCAILTRFFQLKLSDNEDEAKPLKTVNLGWYSNFVVKSRRFDIIHIRKLWFWFPLILYYVAFIQYTPNNYRRSFLILDIAHFVNDYIIDLSSNYNFCSDRNL